VKGTQAQKPGKSRDMAKALVIVIAFHLAAAFGFLYYYLNSPPVSEMASSKKSVTLVPVSKNFQPSTQSPKNLLPQDGTLPPSTAGKEKPYIYSWKDGMGTRHYSDSPPAQDVAKLERIPQPVPEKAARPLFSGEIGTLSGSSKVTRVDIVRNIIYVPVRLGYAGNLVETYLTLDTGASRTTLHRVLADRLGFRKKISSTVIVADGREVPAKIAMLDFIEVGPYRLNFLDVVIVNYQGKVRKDEGLLGVNFLKYVHYDIDFNNRIIRWRRQGEDG